jgi:hypothetical protein
MDLLIDRGGNIDDDVEAQEVESAVWGLGQVCIRISGVTSVEVSMQPTLAGAAALAETQRWIECLMPDEVILIIDENDRIVEKFSRYTDAIDRIDHLDG